MWLFKEFPKLNPNWIFFGQEPMFLEEIHYENEIEELRQDIKLMKSANSQLSDNFSQMIAVIKAISGDLKRLKEKNIS